MSANKRDLDVMRAIQGTKEREIKTGTPLPLDPEGTTLAEHKRFTFDVISTPVDPLR